jgi:hypothetical protein
MDPTGAALLLRTGDAALTLPVGQVAYGRTLAASVLSTPGAAFPTLVRRSPMRESLPGSVYRAVYPRAWDRQDCRSHLGGVG